MAYILDIVELPLIFFGVMMGIVVMRESDLILRGCCRVFSGKVKMSATYFQMLLIGTITHYPNDRFVCALEHFDFLYPHLNLYAIIVVYFILYI